MDTVAGSVLVVDDNSANLRLLRTLLSEEGYDVRVATNGIAALSAAQADPPDLILLDVMMPDLDGYETCKRLKAHERTQEIPVLFVSAAKEAEDKVKSFAAGGVDYITKPFQAEEVLARVKTHMTLSRLRAKMAQEIRLRTAELEEANEQLRREILERSETEGALRLTQFSIDHATVMAAWVGADGQVLYANEAACNSLGYSQEELVGKRVYDVSPAFSAETWAEHWSELKRCGHVRFETQDVGAEGEHYIIEISENFIEYGGREVNCVFAQDITERRRAEEERDRLFEMSVDMLCIAGANGYFRQVNPAWTETLGWSAEELLCTPWIEFVHPEDRKRSIEVGEDNFAGGIVRNFENRYLCKDGSFRWMSWNSFPYLGEQVVFAVVRDVTEHKRAEQELQEEKAFSETVLESLPGIFYVYDETLRLVRWNKNHETLTGYSGEELSEMTLLDWFEGEEKEYVRHAVQGVFEEEREIRVQAHLIVKGGAKIPYDCVGYRLEMGNQSYLIGLGLDISVSVEAQEALRLTQYSVDNSDEAAIWVGLDGRIVYVNKAACRGIGYSREELLAMTVPEIEPDTSVEKWDSRIAEIKRSGHISFDSQFKRKDGRLFPVHVTANYLEFEGREYLIAFARDLSAQERSEMERRELEAQLRQAQKMEAIGTLAGGIAHDFNNILSSIIGNSELAMLNELDEDHPARFSVEQVLKAGHRARDLVQQILQFSRQREEEVKPIAATPIIKETLKLLRSSIPSTIELARDLSAKSDTVLAAPTHIHQIIMNLCTNAAYAMRESGGVLTVSTADKQLKQGVSAVSDDLAPGPYLEICVQDTGDGMPRSVMERVFEPYYTTKRVGEGTGLGLAVVHGIIKSMSGEITVESRKGEGCEFKVMLPSIRVGLAMADDAGSPLPQGSEHVLVIDDEESVAGICQRILRSLGYRVTMLTDSREALAAFEASPHSFDLVVTDMTMPYLRGDEIADRMRSIRPEVPLILCTGYSELMDEDKAKAIGFSEFIMKPLVMRQVAESVRKALDT